MRRAYASILDESDACHARRRRRCVSSRLGVLRGRREQDLRPARSAQLRLGQSGRDQRAAHRQQGRGRADAASATGSKASSRCGSRTGWARAGATHRSRPRALRSRFSSAISIRSSTVSPAARACRPPRASRSRCPGSSGSRWSCIWLVVALLFRMSSLASLVAAIAAPPLAFYFLGNWPEAWALFPIALLLFWRHRANIRKLLAGEERRIGSNRSASAPGGASSTAASVARARPGAERGELPARSHGERVVARGGSCANAARRQARSSRRCRCRTARSG